MVINIYGKPYNTAVTLYSLLLHSGRWIDKIYFIKERKQPHNSEFGFIEAALGEKLVAYTPPLWLWVRPFHNKWLFRIPAFRKAVRYQYGWEQTDKDFLFVTHNDVLYKEDILGVMLGKIGDNIGIGPVGQCWNCSASFAGVCTPETYTKYRPSFEEVQQLLRDYPGSRQKDYKGVPNPKRPWPLPECRLNEWTALINMKAARPLTMPLGPALPFGAFFGLDIGTQWFNDVLNMGQKVAHFNIDRYAHHAWASTTASGHAAFLNENEYAYSERMAEEYLLARVREFGLQ